METFFVEEKTKKPIINRSLVDDAQGICRCLKKKRAFDSSAKGRRRNCARSNLLSALVGVTIATHIVQMQAHSAHAFCAHEHIPRPLPSSQRKPWRIRKSGYLEVAAPSSSNTKLEDCNRPLSDLLSFYTYNLKQHRTQQNTKTAKSLSYFLRDTKIVNTENFSELSAKLTHALILAIRTAGEAGDYRLILKLVESSVQFASGNPILSPRVFGEALSSLYRTKANASKLKQVWTLAISNENILTNPLTAFELNMLMKALAKLGRVRSSIDIFMNHTSERNENIYIVPDSYTASTLFTILRESITSDQRCEKHLSPQPRQSNSTLQSALMHVSQSPSWQWNTAVRLLNRFDFEGFRWNNRAYFALLKLHETAAETYSEHTNGSEITIAILDDMNRQNVLPDEVTCSLVVKCIGDPSGNRMAWKRSIEFLRRMSVEEDLPMPNEFAYSAAIVSCARCSESDSALRLLKEMNEGIREGFDSSSQTYSAPKPNVWVYNAALLAIDGQKTDRQRDIRKLKASPVSKGRVKLAMQVFEQMKNVSQTGVEQLLPDTVTYNTVLSIMRTENPPTEKSVISLIDEMIRNGIPRDAITYRNAILASPCGKRIRRLLQMCLDDDVVVSRSREALHGKASNALTFIFDAALSTCASRGRLHDFLNVLVLMQERAIRPCDDTTSHIIAILGRSGNSKLLPPMLAVLSEDIDFDEFQKELEAKTGISLGRHWLPPLSNTHYSEATSACLRDRNIPDAHRIVSAMKKRGILPNMDCAECFAISYGRAAIDAIRGGKHAAYQRTKMSPKQLAQSAFRISTAIAVPSPATLNTVATSCAITEQWWMAQRLLRSLQRMAVSDRHPRWNTQAILLDLQSGLLRECAHQGNVTAALWLVRDIQDFAASQIRANSSALVPNEHDQEDVHHSSSNMLEQTGVQMTAGNWVSVVKAARKSGHWRVCVNTLQFLRPYVLKTNPSEIGLDDDDECLRTNYKKLVPALVHATACLEIRSQYAWAVRTIKDWVAWSGRKAPPRAVLSVVRVLSARGRGDEVKDLISEVIQHPSTLRDNEDADGQEELLYSGACTALHRNGLYDDADEIYVSGVSNGYLRFSFSPSDEAMVLDLHGLNVALAHSAVRVAMRQLSTIPEKQEQSNVIIITGRGRNSKFHLRPVLRPEIQRMLLEEFYPPLNTVSVPGNMGALLVNAKDIARWQEHQEGQKGARMLAVAAAIKDLSSSRLQKTIALSIKANRKKNLDG